MVNLQSRTAQNDPGESSRIDLLNCVFLLSTRPHAKPKALIESLVGADRLQQEYRIRVALTGPVKAGTEEALLNMEGERRRWRRMARLARAARAHDALLGICIFGE